MRSRAGHGVDRSRAARGPHAGGEHADDDAGVRLQQTFLQALLDSMSSGVAACDADGRMVVFNQSMRQSRPSVPGLHVRDVADAFHLYAADGRSPLQPDQVPLARALGGERVDGEHVIVRLPGTPERRFSVTARPVDAPDGQRLGAMAVMDDITQVHRAQVLRAAQHAVVEALAASPSAEQAATDVVAAVTAALGWRCGEYWEVGPDQSVITRLGAWTAPSRDLSAFLAARPQAMRPGQGWPGPPGPVAARCGSVTWARIWARIRMTTWTVTRRPVRPATGGPSSPGGRRWRPGCAPRSACRCAAARRCWGCWCSSPTPSRNPTKTW
nr:hypothetical protein GCM10020093_039610 [Planobispora longispora]